jgi:hypothetical protein
MGGSLFNTSPERKAQPDANRPAFLDNALVYIGLAKSELFTSNPNNDF